MYRVTTRLEKYRDTKKYISLENNIVSFFAIIWYVYFNVKMGNIFIEGKSSDIEVIYFQAVPKVCLI